MVEGEASSVSTLVPTIPTRPPTPPRRDANHKEVHPTALQRYFSKANPSSPATANISVTTPKTLIESPTADSGSLRKKVEWADLSGLLESPGASVDGPQGLQEPQRPLSASARPTKSILKAQSQNALDFEYGASVPSNARLLPPHHHATFSTMLQSITQQLAGTDRNSRLDAYLMLSSSLKVSDNVPDLRALKDKLELLLSLVKRDLLEKTDAGKPDSSLVINALILLSTFLHNPSIAESITSDFALFAVDYAIRIFEDVQAPKDIVKHLMFILAQQNFNPKIMNRERIGRLVKALHQIEPTNMKGKSIVIGRLNIYRNLLRQSRPHMLAHLDWTEDLFTDMTSNLKEIRTQAIAFGFEAVYSLGAEQAAARCVASLFQLEVDGYGKYGDRYARRLKEMVKSKQDPTAPSSVPQIWSVVILFFRARPRQLEQWSFLSTFIVVMESCFNCSDSSARKEALLAWNRLISIIHLDEKTSPMFVQLLSQPLAKQIQRSNLRASTLSTLYCLLYYALRPSAAHTQLDFYWKSYVIPIVGNCLIAPNAREKPESAGQGLTEACLLLQPLFDSSNPRKWKEARAMENLNQHNFTAKEIPALDAKWVRKSSNSIFQVLDPLLGRLYWDLCNDSDIAFLWRAYVRSIALPAAMEVKVSNDTMATIATIFGSLYRIWHTGPKAFHNVIDNGKGNLDSPRFLKCFEFLVITLLQELGPLPFVERQLCIGTQDTFVPIATPSQHPQKYRGQIRTPLQHLLTLFASASPGLEYDDNFIRLVRRTLSPFFESRKTRHASVELARTLTEPLPYEIDDSSKIIWQVSANFATAAIEMHGPEKRTSNEQPLGLVYRDLTRVLEVGMKLAPFEPISGWKVLFDATILSSTSEAGEAGRAIAVIEPLAKAYLSELSRTKAVPSRVYSQLLIENVSYPRERLALDSANKQLWGLAVAGPKTLFDPYVHFYQFVQLALEVSYRSVNKPTIPGCSDLISATSTMLRRCPFPLILTVLSKLQGGIGLWIMDEEIKTGGGSVLTQSTVSLWAIICDIITRLLSYHDHTKILTELETLMCSGLESKNKVTVNTTIRLWNSSFGRSKQQLSYPIHLKQALLRLRSVTEILLPSASIDINTDIFPGQSLPNASSQYVSSGYRGFDLPSFGSSFRAIRAAEPHLELPPLQRLRQTTPQVILSSTSLKRSRETTPDSRPRKVQSREITPKLRHNDSQVHFEAVNSSPIASKVSGSELLTDRQKEVKERQQAEAAMFPDLRSSPMSKFDSVEPTIDSELELPAYRSSSKLRKNTNTGRQTTPTLVPLSDDDQFVASSPTPTRSLRAEAELADEPPSSPPEALVESNDPNEVEEKDLISPLKSQDAAVIPQDPKTSFYGSNFGSSVVLTAPEVVQAQSDSISHQSEMKPTIALSEKLPLADTPIESEGLASAHGNDAGPRQSQSVESVLEAELQPPHTPTTSQQDSSAVDITPKSPQQAFVDALASPMSSDQKTADEEIFEDAVSSPRLELNRLEFKNQSSPLVDMNDSSLMRVIEDFENQANQPQIHVPATDEIKNQPPRLRSSPRNRSSRKQTKKATPLPNRKADLRRISLLRQEQKSEDTKGKELEKINPDSSIPSLIPETPATSIQEVPEESIDEEDEYDPDDTIVVDDSALWSQEETPQTKGGKGGRSLPQSRKRKLGRMVDSQDEVLDSRIVMGNSTIPRTYYLAKLITAIASDTSSPKPALKRTRSGRASRASQASQETDTIFDPEFSQSAQSTHLVESISDEKEENRANSLPLMETAVEDIMETELELSGQDREESEPNEEEDHTEVIKSEESPVHDEGHDELVIEAQLKDEAAFESTAAESTDEATRSVPVHSNDFSDPVSSDEIMQDNGHSAVEAAEAITSSLVDPSVDANVLSPATADVVHDTEASGITGMKETLQNLIAELRTASLARTEVNELEDLFMDAKGLLYDAGRRGRQSVDR